jgi:hypothetical protein
MAHVAGYSSFRYPPLEESRRRGKAPSCRYARTLPYGQGQALVEMHRLPELMRLRLGALPSLELINPQFPKFQARTHDVPESLQPRCPRRPLPRRQQTQRLPKYSGPRERSFCYTCTSELGDAPVVDTPTSKNLSGLRPAIRWHATSAISGRCNRYGRTERAE